MSGLDKKDHPQADTTPPRQTHPPWADTPLERHPLGQPTSPPPQQTATAADGTHPPGNAFLLLYYNVESGYCQLNDASVTTENCALKLLLNL